MKSEKKSEFVNVQQTEGLTGQVNNQVQTVLDIVSEAVNKKTEREERLERLQGLRVTTTSEVEPEQYAVSVDGVGFFALGDIHLVKGKQKSGKSAALKVCAAALMSEQTFRVKSELQEPVVLYADTEQQLADVKLIVDEVKLLSGADDEYIDSHLHVFTVRSLSYDTLIDDTRLLIDEIRPQVVFIDGIVDYVASFNDEVLSRDLIGKLMKLCDEYGCAIVCCMHENKSREDKNPKGHLGSFMNQKSGTVLECEKQDAGILSMKCPDARHGVMPTWNITFNKEGHIVDADEQSRLEKEEKEKAKAEKRQEKSDTLEQERVDIIQGILREAGGYLTRLELKNRLMEKTKLKDSSAYGLIHSSLGTDIVERNGYIYLPDVPDLFT